MSWEVVAANVAYIERSLQIILQSTVELQALLDKKLIEKIGTTGRGTKYVLSHPNGR